MTKKSSPWVTVNLEPVEGGAAPGIVRVDEEVPGFPAGTTVVIRLRDGKPEIQCRISYQERAQKQAVFSGEDWPNLQWSDKDHVTNFELRPLTSRDMARNAASSRGLVIIAPVIAGILALAPVLLWPAPAGDATLAHTVAANQLAGELASAHGLSPQLRSEAASLQAELRAAQAASAADQARKADNDSATTVYEIAVGVAAVVVAGPEVVDLILGRRRNNA